tara:strand:+ start:1317 stop:1559 length:243 start_codon:yes stop_codon:yes gene_type:complete
MIIGEIIFPKNKPNSNHILFNGFNIFEFNNPNIKKINAIAKDQIFISPDFKIGKNEIIKNRTKNTIPKLRLELNLISEFI